MKKHTLGFQLVLGSKSPRRQELLAGMGFDFEVRTKDTDEDFPATIPFKDVPVFLAEIKANALVHELNKGEVLITSDTIVLLEDEILGKPTSPENAKEMLQKLAGKSHEVITGVHLRSLEKKVSFSVSTNVFFKSLTPEMIDFYVENYKPFDKAGAYGIQEWIGFVGIERIEGSYFNVVGLPVAELWDALNNF
jgi:septum formation protein